MDTAEVSGILAEVQASAQRAADAIQRIIDRLATEDGDAAETDREEG